ncbi:MAG: polymer-forming cytoskeletal protein [Alphaproteobacteria bacterium]|nr:polymer-forming cytoskeletal protein [Alphaproteobacteria bacterium]MBR2482693.1 polymer-forming cytoskeletal protein [Alphaproteobacteria bacterium]
MLAFTNAKEKQSPTIIGAGCELTGDIKTDHIVQIHGLVIGNITAETVVIGRGGRVQGQINATNLFLHGTLDGPATVNIANVFNAAQMTGTLSYRTLNITGNTGLECKLSKRKDKEK